MFVCCFVCTITDFSAAEKARGVIFCMCVGLLSGQVFYHFRGQRSRSPGTKNALSTAKPHPFCIRMVCLVAAAAPADEHICYRARGDIGGSVRGRSELGPAALTKAVWWGMCLASLLMHLIILVV